jgi:ligand-binding SRPBCC domain-containing protein
MKITFEKRSVIPTTMEQMIAFHNDPRTLRWLTPPPIIMQKRYDTRKSLTEGELEFVLWFGPLPVKWTARHEPGPTDTSFRDRMIRGPMQFWLHQHSFREVPGGVELTDHLEYEHRAGLWGIFTRMLFGGLLLKFLFLYRHVRTKQIAPNYKAKTS